MTSSAVCRPPAERRAAGAAADRCRYCCRRPGATHAALAASTTRCSSRSRLFAYGRAARPPAVGLQPRWPRTISGVPSASSSRRRCCDTVDCARPKPGTGFAEAAAFDQHQQRVQMLEIQAFARHEHLLRIVVDGVARCAARQRVENVVGGARLDRLARGDRRRADMGAEERVRMRKQAPALSRADDRRARGLQARKRQRHSRRAGRRSARRRPPPRRPAIRAPD